MEKPMRKFATLLLFATLAGAQGLLAQVNCANDINQAPAYTGSDGKTLTPSTYNIQKVRNLLTYQTPSDYGNGSRLMLVSAHRGFWQYAPENSLRAFYAAVAAGSEIVEIDVRVSSDNVPIMMHDDDIARTTTGTGLAEGNSVAQFQSFQLRDRHGCPSTFATDNGTTFASVLQAFVNKGLIYKDANGVLRGSTLIVDIKGARADKATNFLTILQAYNAVVAQPAYSILSGAVIFKTPLFTLPVNPNDFITKYAWNPSTNNYALIPVILPEDANHQTTIGALQACNVPTPASSCDTLFQSYFSFFYDTAKTQPLVAHFETNQLYNGDGVQAYRDFLADAGNNGSRSFPIAGYAPDNFFPEGEPTGGTCCKEPATLPWTVGTGSSGIGVGGAAIAYTPGPPATFVPDANAFTFTDPEDSTITEQVWPEYPIVTRTGSSSQTPLCYIKTLAGNPGINSLCLDYRGRYDFLLSTGMSIFTVERLPDVIAFATAIGQRNTAYILQ
jgi:hypothetical protein